jgi:hypothetical protein
VRGYTLDRRPQAVTVKVEGTRVTRPCVSDGYYQTCRSRPQPYALVVMGQLFARESDSVVVPPTFTTYRKAASVEELGPLLNATASAAARGRGGGGRAPGVGVLGALAALALAVWSLASAGR